MKIIISLAKVVIVLLAVATGSSVAAEQVNVEYLNDKNSKSTLPFSEAVKVGNTLYLSGKIGINPKTGKLAEGGFNSEAHQTLKNIQTTLEKYGYDMSNVIKCMVMLTDIKDFGQFNKIYKQYFKAPYPARSAFAVSELALGSLVEVECLAVVK
ncbi:RidA family protein [Thalassotalea sp. M1531]|uniref:RidA family protein n=1 Tax=Thalassotalea algicola TaxID=2716224 RepID=A0A7Y0Q5X8_9GAMM|nr:Rid family detoxifying hydrolase [Thalassotalea algicola]NMP30212.1 RidA family protein [Thalassotalea algicola]